MRNRNDKVRTLAEHNGHATQRIETPGPLIIEPNSIWRPPQLVAALGLRDSTLPREVKLGRMRAYRRAGKVFFIGADILEWLRGGELRPQRTDAV